MVLRPQSESVKNTYPTLDESTVGGFKKRYDTQIKEAYFKNKSPTAVIVNKLRVLPCLLGNKIGPLAQKYLKVIDKKGEL